MQVDLTLPNPHPAQNEVLENNSRFRVMMCGRRFGKSLISQTISIEYALYNKKVAYVTPTYQLGKIFFKEILNILPQNICKKNEQDLLIETITGGSIRFFTGENLDAMRGQKFHLVIIDEASFIPNLEGGWNNSIRPTLTDYKGKAIFLSTPRGKNFFYNLFLRGGTSDWASFKFTTYDNPFIDPKEIDDAKRHLPMAVFEQEYMANPMENAANPFGSQFIDLCVRHLSNKPPIFFGIDLAKSVDYTVIIGLDEDGNTSYFERYQKDWTQTQQHILTLPNDATICIDSTGVGDSVVEALQPNFSAMYAIKFTSQSKQQMMVRLVNIIQSGGIGYPDGIIKDELGIIEYQYSHTGVKYSAPSGFHDDTVMALALAVMAYDKIGKSGYHFSED